MALDGVVQDFLGGMLRRQPAARTDRRRGEVAQGLVFRLLER